MTVDIAVRLAAGLVVTTKFALTPIRQFPAKNIEGSRNLRRAWETTERLEIYLLAGLLVTGVAVL